MPNMVKLLTADFLLPVENLEQAFIDLRQTSTLDDVTDATDITLALMDSLEVTDLFDQLDFQYIIYTDGSVGVTDYENKLNDTDRAVFTTLAPHVRDGSYLNWLGDDGHLFRWEFTGGNLIIKHAKIEWVLPDDMDEPENPEDEITELDEKALADLAVRPFTTGNPRDSRFDVEAEGYGDLIPKEAWYEDHLLTVEDLLTGAKLLVRVNYSDGRLYIQEVKTLWGEDER